MSYITSDTRSGTLISSEGSAAYDKDAPRAGRTWAAAVQVAGAFAARFETLRAYVVH